MKRSEVITIGERKVQVVTPESAKSGVIAAPYVMRTAEAIDKIKDFMSLSSQVERHGRFSCIQCGADLTEAVKSIRNDGNAVNIRCPGCGRMKNVDSGTAAMLILLANRGVANGEPPI